MSGTTTKWALPYSTGSDLINTIDNTDLAKATLLDGLLTPYDAGAFASRPVSTAGTPGKAGREYYATDTGRLYLDLGTSWIELAIDRGPEAKLKTIRGKVNSDGTTAAGSGFSSSRTGLGAYGLSFTVVFSAAPAITVTPVSSVVMSGAAAGVETAQVACTNPAGSGVDTAFSFIAIGPA